jgi:hypothetical protein
MSDSQEKREISYFIDEAGDTTLFDRRGKHLLVGNGASKFFILGKILVADPTDLRKELRQLREELLADPYFRGVPSMQPDARKTAVLFHAKDDRPEVRREVFKLLLKHDIKFYAVVRNKTDLSNFVRQQNKCDPAYKFHERDLYETLTRELFGRLRQNDEVVNLLFASRGNITRNDTLRESLKQAEDFFAAKFGFRRKHELNVEAKGSREDECLQACDYFMWALQRHFEREESGFIEMLWEQVGEVVDLDVEHDGKRGLAFGPKRPIADAGAKKKPVDIGSPGTNSGTTRHGADFCPLAFLNVSIENRRKQLESLICVPISRAKHLLWFTQG